jgi:hypothetical protein
MPNGKKGDHPLSDLILHGAHPFPRDMEEVLLRIHALGRAAGRWPLGQNWPYSPREFHWERGEGLEEGRKLLLHLEAMLLAGRGDEVLIDPPTGKPLGAR